MPAVLVQAVHDGRTIAFRLEWEDAVANTHSGKVEAFKDAVALELVRGPQEPFFGMGATDAPIDLWMWDADRGQPGGDLEEVNPRVVVDVYPFNEKAVETAEYPGRERKRPSSRRSRCPQTVEVMTVLEMYKRHLKDYEPEAAAEMSGAQPS